MQTQFEESNSQKDNTIFANGKIKTGKVSQFFMAEGEETSKNSSKRENSIEKEEKSHMRLLEQKNLINSNEIYRENFILNQYETKNLPRVTEKK